MKKWKPLLAILWLLLALILPACQPHLTYDELIEAEKVAPTQQEKDALEKRIDKFERHAEESNEFFALRNSCSSYGLVWLCDNAPYSQRRVDQLLESDLTLDERVRLYRRLRTACSCTKTSQL